MSDIYDPLAEAPQPPPGHGVLRSLDLSSLAQRPLNLPSDIPPPPGITLEDWSANQIPFKTPEGEETLIPRDRLTRQIAEAGVPRWEADRQELVEILHELTGRKRADLYANLEGTIPPCRATTGDSGGPHPHGAVVAERHAHEAGHRPEA